MIEIHQAVVPNSRTSRGQSYFEAVATIDGKRFAARSRHGAPNHLARILVAENAPDQPVRIFHQGVAGYTDWPSLHKMAEWTYTEGEGILKRVRWKPMPDFSIMDGNGVGKNRGEPDERVSVEMAAS